MIGNDPYAPIVDEEVAIVKVEDCPEDIEAGVNVATAPEGKPVTPKYTAEVKPFCPETDIVYDAVWPYPIVRDDGLTESEKSGGLEFTVTGAFTATKSEFGIWAFLIPVNT
jgi:hypothetical protein